MLWKKKLIIPLILFLLTLSLISTVSATTPIASTNIQTKTSDPPEVIPPEMKFVKEVDIYHSSGEIIYVWNWQYQYWYGLSTWIVVIYSKEYNETTGTYYYALTEAEIVGSSTTGYVTITEWNVTWQIKLNTSIAWGRIADLDGDNLPEIVIIPSTENITIIYDDDGAQLTNFTIPEYERVLAIADWTGDGVDDVILVEGAYYDLISGEYYLEITIFDIYVNQTMTVSPIYISSDFSVNDAFAGDWDLSASGNEVVVIDYWDAEMMILYQGGNCSQIISPTANGYFENYIALSDNYIAVSFYDSNFDAYGVAVLYNGSLLWTHLLPSNLYIKGLEITELDGDKKPELIVMTSDDVRIYDIEKKPEKAIITGGIGYIAAIPLDLDADGICEVILLDELGIGSIYPQPPFSEWFDVPCWEPYHETCSLLNSTSLNDVSSVTLFELPNTVFLFVSDIDDDSLLEFFGVSIFSSEILSVYSIMEAVPPVVDIVSPVNGSWVGTYVSVDVSASDELSGVYAVELLINGSSQGYYYPPDYDIYWDASEYAEGTYNLTVVAYDNVNNTASKSIVVHLDKTSPVVGVVSPANGSWVSGVVKISVPVSDVGAGVDYVAFGIYGQPELLYNDTVEPYEYSWDTRNYAEGKQLLVIVVKDKAGNYQCVILEYYVDNTPPSISAVEYPSEVKGGEVAKINITVTDARSGVSEVILSYSVDGGKTWTNITATAKGGDIYGATIPGQSAGKTVQFKVIAFDIAGNIAVSSTHSYKVTSGISAPKVSSSLIIGIGVAVAVIAAAVFIMIRRRK